MISKEQFLESLAHESNICKHLHGKLKQLPPEALEFRFSEKQRSTLELLQYLAHCAIVPMRAILANDWSNIQDAVAKSKETTFESFHADLDRQLEECGAALAGIGEEEFRTRTGALPMGMSKPLGLALIEFPLKFMAAYRLQLFLHLKAAGLTELGTANCWMGVDMPSKGA